jgi:hypothetical protein
VSSLGGAPVEAGKSSVQPRGNLPKVA